MKRFRSHVTLAMTFVGFGCLAWFLAVPGIAPAVIFLLATAMMVAAAGFDK